MKKAAKIMTAVLREAQEFYPDANIYNAMESIHLMSGLSHEGWRDTPRQDRIIASCYVPGMGGGDW